MPVLSVRHLGVVSYDEALALQERLVEDRRADRIPDTLLLLEHPHVITLGVRVHRDRSHIIGSADALARRGVEVRESGRGGDVTYHGPGQLVGYPIFDAGPGPPGPASLRPRPGGGAHRRARAPGDPRGARERADWRVGRDEKIAAIGVRISRWITSHGFALNVSTDLDYFGLIVPCGITDRGVTSVSRVLGETVAMEEVEAADRAGNGRGLRTRRPMGPGCGYRLQGRSGDLKCCHERTYRHPLASIQNLFKSWNKRVRPVF